MMLGTELWSKSTATKCSDSNSFIAQFADVIPMSISSFEETDPQHLHQTFRLTSADGKLMILKGQADQNIQVLRLETNSLMTEARVIEMVKKRTDVPIPQLLGRNPSMSSKETISILYEHCDGQRLEMLSKPPSSSQRETIESSFGAHLATLSHLVAVTFGCADKVLNESGFQTWHEALTWRFRSVLRDAEDAGVSLPYGEIGRYWQLHSHVLGEISEAQLVLLDADLGRKVLIDEQSLEIIAILGWSSATWGDPFAAKAFAYYGSEALLCGYGKRPATDKNGVKRALL